MGKYVKLGKVALEKLSRFEQELNPQKPEGGFLSARIIGYGEMSTVFRFSDAALGKYAFKRMAIFENTAEVKAYEALYLQYHAELKKRAIDTPDFGCEVIEAANGKPVVYILQALLKSESIANKRLHTEPLAQNLQLYKKILIAIDRVFAANSGERPIALGFDGQISNWAFDKKLLYIDTSTPLTRQGGREQLDAQLFLRICPSYLVWIIELFFLKDVMGRYYDLRAVVLDSVGNLFKEKRGEWVSEYLRVANDFLAERQPSLAPISLREVEKYYAEDKRIWRLFLFFRKVERWVRTQILRRRYEIILPEKIER